MKTLLISGLGGSLFPYLSELLIKKYTLVFVDSNEYLKEIYGDYNFHVAPLVNDAEYIPFIKKIIQDSFVDFYVPLIDEELFNAKTYIDGFNGVKVISPNANFIELSLNKYHLMQVMAKEKISDIESYTGANFSEQIPFPLFLKPICGRGSQGIREINTADQLIAYYSLEERQQKDTLIQPAIRGIEYTVGVTVNNLNDIIAISSKRVISKKGITQIAVTENNDIINKVVEDFVRVFKPCGPINIQLFLTESNEVKIFEVNPRFSTTTIMEYEGGLDLISLYIEYLDKHYNEKPLSPLEDIRLFRRWESLFV